MFDLLAAIHGGSDEDQTSPTPLNDHPEAFVKCKLSMSIVEQRSTGQHVIDDHPPHAPDLFKPAGHRRRSDIRHVLVHEDFVQCSHGCGG